MRPTHHVPGLLGPLFALGFLILLVAAVAVLIWWLVKRRKAVKTGFAPQPLWQPGSGPVPPGGPQPGHPPVPQPANAVQILDDRLARGDIDVDDYLTRRAALLGDRPPNGTEFQHHQPDAPEA